MKLFITTLFFLTLTLTAFSQRTWIETEVTKELGKKFELSVSPQARFRENLDLKEYFIETSLEYKFHEYLQLAAGYRFGYDINKKQEHLGFGRIQLDAKTGFEWNNLQPKFRLRYTNADDFGDNGYDAVHYLRYKFELEYNIKKINTEPYVLYELYHDLQNKGLGKTRLESGLVYRINKKHRVGAYYRLNDYLNIEKTSIHIIGILYKLKL